MNLEDTALSSSVPAAPSPVSVVRNKMGHVGDTAGARHGQDMDGRGQSRAEFHYYYLIFIFQQGLGDPVIDQDPAVLGVLKHRTKRQLLPLFTI